MYFESSLPIVSKEECIASWGIPISAVKILSCDIEIFPRVDQPLTSLLLKKTW